MRKSLLVFLVPVVALGCGVVHVGSDSGDGLAGSGSLVTSDIEHDSTEDFGFDIELVDAPEMMRGMTTVDARYQIKLRNRTKKAVTVRRIDLQSVGGGPVQMENRQRGFNKGISAGEEQTFNFWARLNVSDYRMGADVPLIVRATVYLVDDDGERSATFTRNVGRLSVAVGQRP